MAAQQLQFEWGRSATPEGEARKDTKPVFQVSTASDNAEPISIVTMEEVVRKENLLKALKRVKANKGSPGIDGMMVGDLQDFLRDQWPTIPSNSCFAQKGLIGLLNRYEYLAKTM